ncbi:MAG: hypothetical protein ABS54_01345 [Hyphomicrobium sp. SCN 65-11]|nr:MAG: hypothetical protein ABS54_01345 [Hyphomicrobium sp. SCN 65-11]
MTNAAKLPVAAAPSDERLRSRCLPLLSALARPGAVLMASGNPEDPVAIVVSSRADVATPSAAFAPEDAEAAASQGWIEAAGDGWGWKITRAGAAVVRAALASGVAARAAASPMPVARRPAEKSCDVQHGASRDAGGSLAWLHSRRDKDGQPLISAEQLAAGERLAGDLWRARMTPRVTSVWTGVPGDAGSRRASPGAGIDIADTVIAAKARVERALRAVGPEFAGPLIDVCGHMLGLDDIERTNGLPMRSGKMLLRTALTRLARHYGLLPPEHGEAEIARRIAGWMAEDGAVSLEAWRNASSASPR